MNYTEQEMIDCFTAGVKFARDMMNNPSNTEYIMQINNEKQVKNNIVLADVSGSFGFDEGYSKGYSDAQREAAQEIREHYHPNDR
jgi:hypothetical protein